MTAQFDELELVLTEDADGQITGAAAFQRRTAANTTSDRTTAQAFEVGGANAFPEVALTFRSGVVPATSELALLRARFVADDRLDGAAIRQPGAALSSRELLPTDFSLLDARRQQGTHARICDDRPCSIQEVHMFEKLKEGAATAAADKAQEVLRDFNEVVPTLKGLGLSVRDVAFKMGVPPEIGVTLVGSIASLDQGKIKALSDQHRENKGVTAILEALRTAAHFKDQLGGIGFRGVRVDVKLGILPNVEVGLIGNQQVVEIP